MIFSGMWMRLYQVGRALSWNELPDLLVSCLIQKCLCCREHRLPNLTPNCSLSLARSSSKDPFHYTGTWTGKAWLDGAEVNASGWGSGGPRFQSHPRLTFQSCSRFQLNQLGSKAASESTFKKSNTCGVLNTRLYFTLEHTSLLM